MSTLSQRAIGGDILLSFPNPHQPYQKTINHHVPPSILQGDVPQLEVGLQTPL